MTQKQAEFIEKLVQAHQLKLQRIATHLTNDEWTAADLTQEVFEAASRKVEELMEHPTIEKWLIRALVYQIKNEFSVPIVVMRCRIVKLKLSQNRNFLCLWNSFCPRS